jgi:hypothetical protein
VKMARVLLHTFCQIFVADAILLWKSIMSHLLILVPYETTRYWALPSDYLTTASAFMGAIVQHNLC